jgi:hypothetical protein
MRFTMDLRPSRLLVGVGALALAATVGAGFASAGRAGVPATGSPSAPAFAATADDPANAGTTTGLADDVALAAAVDRLAGGTDLAAAPKGAGLLRAIVGRTERAEITVSTADGQRVVLYVRGTMGAASTTSVTITLKDGTKQAFTIDSTTRVRGGGKVRTIADIATAPRGFVLGVKNADGTFTAKFVHLGLAAPKSANPVASPAP